MSYYIRQEIAEQILAAANATAIDNTIVISEIAEKSGHNAKRVYTAIYALRKQGRWPFTHLRYRPGAPRTAAPKPPKRKKRPPISDPEAYRAWAEEEVARLKHAALGVVGYNTKRKPGDSKKYLNPIEVIKHTSRGEE